MTKLYSGDDVTRWEKANSGDIDLHHQKLAERNITDRQKSFHLGMLMLAHHTWGMIYIAKQCFDNAIQSFRDSSEVLCRIYECCEQGQGESKDAGDFQSVLIAYVTKDDQLIGRLVSHYRADEGVDESIFLGTAIKLIATGDLEGAKVSLAQKQPKFERQFMGFAECLKGIAHKDLELFRTALQLASQNWAKWAARAEKGLPNSVCFIQGAGLIRLAEQVFGRKINISNEFIPQELLG